MKTTLFATMLFLTILTLPCVGESATFVIDGNIADAEVNSTGGINTTDINHIIGQDVQGDQNCVVYVFQLPDIGSDIVESANFVFNTTGYGNVPPSNALFGIGFRSQPTVLPTDYFLGSDDPTDAWLITDNVWNPSMGLGPINTDSTANQALVNYLNAQYNSGVSSGDYVFLRINFTTDIDARLGVSSADNSFATTQLTIETSPEAQNIPTLSEWGMILLSLLLGYFAIWYIRKQSHTGQMI